MRQATGPGRPAKQGPAAAAEILEFLRLGRKPAADCLALASEANYSTKTLKRVKVKLGIRSVKNGREHWYWEPPPKASICRCSPYPDHTEGREDHFECDRCGAPLPPPGKFSFAEHRKRGFTHYRERA